MIYTDEMQFLPYFQIILGTLLIGSILLQQRGASLGSSFGGEGSSYSSRRGIEKKLFIATIALSILFTVSAFISLFLHQA